MGSPAVSSAKNQTVASKGMDAKRGGARSLLASGEGGAGALRWKGAVVAHEQPRGTATARASGIGFVEEQSGDDQGDYRTGKRPSGDDYGD